MLTPTVVLAIPVLTPVKSTLPIAFVPIPAKSVLKSTFNILISWSLVNFSVGVNNKFFSPVLRISESKSPSFNVVKSCVFSRMYALFSSVKVINSVNWVSNVSGSIIWTR